MDYTWIFLHIIISFIEFSSFIMIIRSFLGTYEKIKKHIALFYFAILIYIFLFTFYDFKNTYFPLIIYLLYTLITFRGNMFTKIKYYIISLILLGLIGITVFFSVKFIAPNKNLHDLNIINTSRDYLNAVLSCLVILFIKNFKEQILNKHNPYKRSILLIIGIVILFLTGLTVYYSKTDYSIESFELILTLIYVGILAIVVAVLKLYSNYYKRLKVEHDLSTKLTIERLTGNYFNELSGKTEELISLRHDIGNHLLALEGHLLDGSIKESIQYLNTIMKPYKASNNLIITNDRVVTAILTDKKAVCDHFNIPFTIQTSVHSVPILETEIITIIGNILDNAIEATQKIDENEKQYIDFIIKSSDSSLVIKCENSFNETPKVFKDNFITIKKDAVHHGIGLKNVKDIVNKYNGQIKTTYENNIFIISIDINFDQ